MNDEQVFQLLVETNPVADPDGLDSPVALSQLERRSPNMATSERISIETPGTRPGRDPQRNRILIGVAIGVLALVVGLGTVAVIGGDKDAAVEPEVSVVVSATEARNRGDIDAYKAFLTPELAAEQGDDSADPLSYANPTTQLVDCRVTGTAPGGEAIVECAATETDDFYGAGGIQETGTARFLVTDDDKISSSETVSEEEADLPWEETPQGAFNLAFFTWLMNAHPAAFEEIAPSDLSDIPGITANPFDPHDPAEMGIAVQYVVEFVAQSDVYPINP